ncbi:hypothetical protein [Caulobacter hibisci]|uniref:Uncharacterized protein n=1 Tax=Caulobacter hibisci TaxID=2035993 RepID=A0ABS0SRD3_9CAUL|nr:hypothetical protein [Caulobacter hibisci]MBI1682150.1 hypothetical protein [Caulobacter hibisci]
MSVITPAGAVLAGSPHTTSPLLRLIAPDYADTLAALWPAPHTPFLTAPAARRHLVCLMLASEPADARAVEVGALLDAPLRKVVRLVVDPAPDGLRRALERLGEIAWSPADYRALLTLLAEPATAKRLRHAEAITVEQIRTLAALPSSVREAGGTATRLTPAQAELLAEAHAMLRRRLSPGVLDDRVGAWSRAANTRTLFGLVADDFRHDLPKPPHPGTEKLRPLETIAAIRDAARRYRNCLDGYVDHALDERSAIYEWLPQPGAVIELTPDSFFGWRLDQARLQNNKGVDEATREAIVAELRGMGLHVGRSAWQIRRALNQAASPGFKLEPVDAAIAEYFTDD